MIIFYDKQKEVVQAKLVRLLGDIKSNNEELKKQRDKLRGIVDVAEARAEGKIIDNISEINLPDATTTNLWW